MIVDKFLLLFAVIADRLIGDPRSKWHPVVLIGNLISFGEKNLHCSAHSPWRQKIAGGLLALTVLSVTYGVVWLVMEGLHRMNPVAGFIGGILMLSFVISPRSLAEAGWEIRITYCPEICRRGGAK